MVDSETISKCDSENDSLEPPENDEEIEEKEKEIKGENNNLTNETEHAEKTETEEDLVKNKEGSTDLKNSGTEDFCFSWWSEGFSAFSVAAAASVFLAFYSISIPLSTKGLDRIDTDVYPSFVYSIVVSIVIYVFLALVIKLGIVVSLLSEEACQLHWRTRRPLLVIAAGISSCIALGLKVRNL